MTSLDNETRIVLEEQPRETRREILYRVSKSYIGVETTPKDEVPDQVACVASLQEVYRKAFGHYIGTGAALYNTRALKEALLVHQDFERIQPGNEMFGDVCVFPTGENTHSTSPNVRGHVFVVGKRDWMSNDSSSGLWKANWTKDSALRYFVRANGFPQFVFRPKD